MHSFEAKDTKIALKRNLDHMLESIDRSFYYGANPDLLQFHELPLQGWRRWNRKEVNQLSIELPGPESEAIAKKCREYNTWIVFGAYVRDPDWPGHVLSISTIMNNKGEIVAKHWKERNIKGVFPGFELFTTTVYDVLERQRCRRFFCTPGHGSHARQRGDQSTPAVRGRSAGGVGQAAGVAPAHVACH